jgi:tRNA G18 (ribose-2'-O)-methylase SpoU
MLERTSKLERRRTDEWSEKSGGKWRKRAQPDIAPSSSAVTANTTDATTATAATTGNFDIDTAGDPDRLLRKAETVIGMRCCNRLVLVLERCTSTRNYTAVIRTAECMGIQNVWVVHPPNPAKNKLQPSGENAEEGGNGGREGRKARGRREKWVEDEEEVEVHMAYARQAMRWLHIRVFRTTAECVAALRGEGEEGEEDGAQNGKFTVWATDLSQGAHSLDYLLPSHAPLPASAADAQKYFQVPPAPGRLAIVMGTESTGVTAELLAAADRRVYLQMRGFADSLNLSVAAALVLQKVLGAMHGSIAIGQSGDAGADGSAGAAGADDADGAAGADGADVDGDIVSSIVDGAGDATPAQRQALRREWYPLLARSAAERACFVGRLDTGDIPPPFKVATVLCSLLISLFPAISSHYNRPLPIPPLSSLRVIPIPIPIPPLSA